jgi:membrane fusion protein (multidrug efflux system)
MAQTSAATDDTFSSTEDHPAAKPVVVAAKPNKGMRVILGIGAALAIIGGGYYVMHRGLEDTDDAQLDNDVTAVPAQTAAVALKVHFVENQAVKKGDLLVELDDAPTATKLAQAEANYQAALAMAAAADSDEKVTELNVRTNKSAAKAQVLGASSGAVGTKEQIAEAESGVVSSQATFDKAKLDLERGKQLIGSGAIAQQQLDNYQTAFNTAQANLNQAKARLDTMRANTTQALSQVQMMTAKYDQVSDTDVLLAQAKAKADTAHAQAAVAKAERDEAALQHSYTKIYAPVDGTVSRKTVEVGQMTALGQGIAELVPAQAPWVTANFKETQLTHMKPGQPVKLEIDSYPDLDLHGEVESLSGATGARFALLPPDNATGNYTKIVQRLPVRIKITDLPQGVTLRPGLSVDAVVDTRK